MTFHRDEIRIEADVTAEEMADFVTFKCPNCGHPDIFHPEMAGAATDRVWCAECAHDFGTWDELRAKLFVGVTLLDATLSRRG